MSTVPRTPTEYGQWYVATIPPDVKWGECWCGCTATVPRASRTDRKALQFKGQPIRYKMGHQRRTSCEPYRVDKDTGCWIWLRSQTSTGYGSLAVRGRGYKAHRYYYEQLIGPIPSHFHLHHLCGNSLCVNPEHMKAVSRHEHLLIEGTARLTLEEIVEIKRLLMKGELSQAQIARSFKISSGHMSLIAADRCWSSVPWPQQTKP